MNSDTIFSSFKSVLREYSFHVYFGIFPQLKRLVLHQCQLSPSNQNKTLTTKLFETKICFATIE